MDLTKPLKHPDFTIPGSVALLVGVGSGACLAGQVGYFRAGVR